ncbi:MAG: crotonase/enoyl-CoA hydratase family protein [Rhodothalassiaceae bacterium]
MAEDLGRIDTERDGEVLIITLNRPAKLNGLTPEMLDALITAYTQLEQDNDLRVGLLRAAGDHFTAGLDLPRFQDRFGAGDFAPVGRSQVDPFGLKGRSRSKPMLCAVKGICFTAGLELMLAADIAVAAHDTRFSQLEPKRGLMAVGGATFRFVERMGWGEAMRWLLTGDEFDAREALKFGLVQECVETGAEADRALALAHRIARNAPLAVQATLANARTFARQGEAAAIAEFDAIAARLAATDDFAEGVKSFQEKRNARFQGR